MPDTCRNCGEEGHRAKECEKERVIKCRNCDEEGHTARECDKPKDMSRVQCRNCDECKCFADALCIPFLLTIRRWSHESRLLQANRLVAG